MPEKPPPGSLERKNAWLYPDPKKPCKCDSVWSSAGRIDGINMGMDWHRSTTNPNCYHHGTAAQKFYADNLRRFKQTGDWAEFHIDRDAWEAEHNG